VAQQEVPVINLRHAFSMRINNSGRIEFEGAMRKSVFEPVSGGEIWGPRLQGRVVPQSGADYATNELTDAHMMLQAADGTWIHMNLLGFEHADNGEAYFRVAPYFDTPRGTHEWLSKTVFVGKGERHQNPSHCILHIHEVL